MSRRANHAGQYQCSICGRWKAPSLFRRRGFELSSACGRCIDRTAELRRGASGDAFVMNRVHRLPVLPLQLALRERLEIESRTALAAELHVNAQTVRDVARGRHATVTLDKADRLAIGLGSHIDLLYDEA